MTPALLYDVMLDGDICEAPHLRWTTTNHRNDEKE